MMKYVITGPARSGTKYAATLLSNAGLVCGHENVFNSWGGNFTRAPRWQDEKHYLGDSSFIAAPFLPELDLKVVHLVRPPLDVVRSIVGIAHVGDNRAPWVQFLDAHIHLTQFPPGPQRAAAYWVRWNRLIQDHGPDLVWDVTDIQADDITELAMLAGIDADPSMADMAVAETARTINHRQRAEWVTFEHLGRMQDEVVALAEQLGVPLESPMGSVWPTEPGEATADASPDYEEDTLVEREILVSHLGAGWYELIDVETNEALDRVRGKEAAEARKAELEVVQPT